MRTITLLVLLALGTPAYGSWTLTMAENDGVAITNISVMKYALERDECLQVLSYLGGWLAGKHEYRALNYAGWRDDGTYDVIMGIEGDTKVITLTCFEAFEGRT